MMFFRLTNSPAMFQTMMNKILWDLINMEKVASFIDDVIIRMEGEEGHDELVKEVVRRLVENNLYIKPEMLLSGEKHKRTRQEVSAKLESYLYCYRLVYTTTSCLPYVMECFGPNILFFFYLFFF